MPNIELASSSVASLWSDVNSPSPTSSAEPLAWPSLGEQAYQRIEHMADALSESELPRINASLSALTITALGAMPRIQGMRAEIERRAPQHDLTWFNAFGDIVLALTHVEALVRASSAEKRPLAALAAVLDTKRRQLRQLAVALAGYGLMDGAPLQPIGKEAGYKALVSDVATLVQLFIRNWATVGPFSPVTLQELAELDRDALKLNGAIGLKEQVPDRPRKELMQRRRVYALFRLAVKDIRRLAFYLFQEEGRKIVPAFSHGSKAKKRRANADNSQNQPAPANLGLRTCLGSDEI